MNHPDLLYPIYPSAALGLIVLLPIILPFDCFPEFARQEKRLGRISSSSIVVGVGSVPEGIGRKSTKGEKLSFEGLKRKLGLVALALKLISRSKDSYEDGPRLAHEASTQLLFLIESDNGKMFVMRCFNILARASALLGSGDLHITEEYE